MDSGPSPALVKLEIVALVGPKGFTRPEMDRSRAVQLGNAIICKRRPLDKAQRVDNFSWKDSRHVLQRENLAEGHPDQMLTWELNRVVNAVSL